jgi:uncharacterized protein (TIGR01777 family)
MRISSIMLFAVTSTSRLVAGFHLIPRNAKSSKLSATFFEDFPKTLSRAFSSMANGSDSKYYTIGITGAGGLVGTALRDELGRRETLNGKPVRVVRLSRGDVAEQKVLDNASETTLVYNPKGSSADEVIDLSAAAEMDAIVHLAGESVATGLGPLGFLGLRPWTNEKKKEILDSRIIPTAALAKVVASSPSLKTFLVASGVGAYGDNFIGEDSVAVDETMDISTSSGFLAEVSRQWEAASEGAKTSSNRVVNMRFGVVMSTKGGALGKLYPIFFVGGGGNVGAGNQYFSFISARDHARAIVHALETSSLKGPVNFCAPQPCTNAEFTKALGKVMGRPTIVPLPSFAVSLLFGEMGQEMLLGGVRATPAKLVKSGFQFSHPTIEEALQSAMEENI